MLANPYKCIISNIDHHAYIMVVTYWEYLRLPQYYTHISNRLTTVTVSQFSDTVQLHRTVSYFLSTQQFTWSSWLGVHKRWYVTANLCGNRTWKKYKTQQHLLNKICKELGWVGGWVVLMEWEYQSPQSWHHLFVCYGKLCGVLNGVLNGYASPDWLIWGK